MSLTQHQLQLLIDSDYDVGKFYIALNTKDDNGINWFKYYDERLEECVAEITSLTEDLEVWAQADQFDREALVKQANEEADAIIQAEIDKLSDIVRGLSKVIHGVTSLAADSKIDPQHISENNLMTEILEEISQKNETISKLKSKLLGDSINLEKEVLSHEKALKESLKQYEEEVVSLTENRDMMLERQSWLQDTFNISDDEKQEIINNYE